MPGAGVRYADEGNQASADNDLARTLFAARWRRFAQFGDLDDTNVLLIVWHSRTGASHSLAVAATAGAGPGARLLAAGEAEPADLLEARGYLFVCPENLGSMSGAMKEMFDRCYYPLLGKIEGRPYASIIAAGSAGHGAQAQLDRIVTGWRLRRVSDPLIANLQAQAPEEILAAKSLPPALADRAHELGEALANGLELGIF